MSRYGDCKVYVGDLGSQASKADLEDAFGYYGPLRNVWVARNPPGFAFIEFEDARDAEDAVRGLDGRNVCGRRVRVEPSSGAGGRRRDRGPPRRRFNPDDRCYECGDRGHYARDCRRRGHRSSRRSRSSSRSPRFRTRSRSGSRGGKSRSRSPIKSRSKSPVGRRSSSRSRSRGPSEKQNGRD